MKTNKTDPYSIALSLGKTAATGLIISGIVSFVAMFFLLRNAANNDQISALSYYLPWCLPYGIPDIVLAALGVYWLTHEMKKPYEIQVFGTICIVGASLVFGGAFPYIAVWGNVEFFIATMVIAIMEIGISVLAIRAYRKGE